MKFLIAGNPNSKTDANGITVGYVYDLLNRLTDVHFPDSSQNITYSYDQGTDGIGRRTGIIDPAGSIDFTYDSRGRLVGKTSTVMGYAYPVSRSFTPGGRLTSLTYPSGRTIDYTRYSTGRIQAVSTTYNSNTVTLVNNLSYNPFDMATGLDTGSGGNVNNVTNENGNLELINPGEQMEQVYTYDGNGNLITIRGTNTPWYDQDFVYDPLNRLANATGLYGTIGYTYDDVGNRLTRTIGSQAENYTYVPGTSQIDQITGVGDSVSYTYDANGNVTGMGNKTLIYNQNNRLIRVEENSNILGEYTYNGLGQRVIKTIESVSTIFHYDFDGNLIAESASDGTFNVDYLYVDQARMAMVDVSSGAVYYFLNNYLGTPVIMTDYTNTIVWEADYKPFGEADINPNSEVVNNFRFAGQYYDSETGLHYNYHRYYDPNTGIYLTPDPIGLMTAVDLYTYVQNDPINKSDPLGLFLPFGGPGFVNVKPSQPPSWAEQMIIYQESRGNIFTRSAIPGQFGTMGLRPAGEFTLQVGGLAVDIYGLRYGISPTITPLGPDKLRRLLGPRYLNRLFVPQDVNAAELITCP